MDEERAGAPGPPEPPARGLPGAVPGPWAPPPPDAVPDPWAPPPAAAPAPSLWPPAYPPPYAPQAGPPPYVPYAAPPRRRFAVLPWVTLALALLVLVADVAVVSRRHGRSALPRSVAVERGLVAESPREASRRALARDAAVDAMFDRRARAVRDRDLAAFLADVDPWHQAFVARQREVFDSLGKLDFGAWSYERTGDSYSPASIDYARYGRVSDIWLPVLILRYRLAGFDVAEVGRRVVYTVVRRGGRWYIGGDTDLEATTSSGTSVRVDPWENGPIVVDRGPRSIVIGHPEDRDAVRRIRREVEDAVRHVVRYVGRKGWNRKVVVILPTDDAELDRVLENPTTYFEFAAVARPLATMPRGDEDVALAGARVVINPDGFDSRSDFTRHLIRHEITHIAMFDRVGPLTPKWLVEGVAEYVGNAESDLPPESLAGDLAAAVRKDGVPTSLPTDSDFGLINDAGVGYNGAWLLCRYIVSRYGRAKLFEFHDAMGTPSGQDRPGDKLPNALRTVLGTDRAALLRGWRQYVRASVGDLTKLLVNPAGYRRLLRGRLTVQQLTAETTVRPAALEAAGLERITGGVWVDGPTTAPRRRAATTLLVAADERGAAEVQRLYAERLRPYDGAGRPLPHGRIFYVGTDINGRHYNEMIGIVRAGTVVIEVRVAVPGTGDASAEVRRLAAAQHARFAT